MPKPSRIEKYLKDYSQAIACDHWPDHFRYSYVMILPVCGETTDCLHEVMATVSTADVLVVVLINRPKEHPKTSTWKQQNQQLIDHFIESSESINLNEGVYWCRTAASYDVLLLDFNDHPFDANRGVGQARRIAADTALSLIQQGRVTVPWIHSTDADVHLPASYFGCTDGLAESCVALSLPFQHVSEDPDAVSLQSHYDFKLYYYQQAMRFVGSRYDYIPLGSTLVVNAEAYAQVRGFPCRSGGEDFYLLNKLAKVGHINQPQEPVVDIKVRMSDRVPFGTGPAIKQIQEDQAADVAARYYHPQIFHELKQWRAALLDFYDSKQPPEAPEVLNNHWQIKTVLDQAYQQIQSPKRWQQFIDEWLDAFKLLRSVHVLQQDMPPLSQDELQLLPAYQDILAYKDVG